MLTNVDKHNILNNVVDARVSYIGNTPAFQAGKVGSIPTTRSIMVNVVQLVERQFVALVVVGSSPIVHPI